MPITTVDLPSASWVYGLVHYSPAIHFLEDGGEVPCRAVTCPGLLVSTFLPRLSINLHAVVDVVMLFRWLPLMSTSTCAHPLPSL